jgi:membrane protein
MASALNTAHEIGLHVAQVSTLWCGAAGELFKEMIKEWSSDKVPRLAASLAFYTLLSLAPLLVVTVAVASLAYGQQAAAGQLVSQIQRLVGSDGARVIQALVHGADKRETGLIATLIAILTLIFGASSVVVELRDALNTIWHRPLGNGGVGLRGIAQFAKERLYSFAFVLGAGFLLLVSLVLSASIAAIGRYFGSLLPASELLLQLGTFIVSFFVITFLFAAIYKLLPDVALQWRDVAVGACVTGLLFSIGKQLIALYLGKASFASAYGAAGSLVVLIFWVYYSALLFFLGAEFTKVYRKVFGSQLATRPKAASSP